MLEQDLDNGRDTRDTWLDSFSLVCPIKSYAILCDLRSSCAFMHKRITPCHEWKDHRMLRLGPHNKAVVSHIRSASLFPPSPSKTSM